MLNDKICVDLHCQDADQAISLARLYRACSRTVQLGPALLASEGARVVRQLQTVNATEMLLDARLVGTADEVSEAVTAASYFAGMRGITVAVDYTSPTNLAAAVTAAAVSKVITGHINPPRIIAYDPELAKHTGASKYARAKRVKKLINACAAAKVHAAVLAFENVPLLRAHDMRMRLFVRAARKAHDYTKVIPEEVRSKPGIHEILTAGADYVIFDTGFATGCDEEWEADLLKKELDAWKRDAGRHYAFNVSHQLLFDEE